MKVSHWIIAALLAILVVLHQDYWQWDNATLVWGFLPHTLLWHAALSIGCAIVWALAVVYCWPKDVDLVPTGPDPIPDQSKSLSENRPREGDRHILLRRNVPWQHNDQGAPQNEPVPDGFRISSKSDYAAVGSDGSESRDSHGERRS